MEFILNQGQSYLLEPKNFKTYLPSIHEWEKAAFLIHLLLPASMGRSRKLKNVVKYPSAEIKLLLVYISRIFVENERESFRDGVAFLMHVVK